MGNAASKRDIRFNEKVDPLRHDSARGKVVRNSGNFTRGSQLTVHNVVMWWKGAKLPLILWACVTGFLIVLLGALTLQPNELQLVGMKLYAWLWEVFKFDPTKTVNLTLQNGDVVHGEIQWVPYHAAVDAAWDRMAGVLMGGFLGGAFFSVPVTIWFIDFSNRKGSTIMQETHERGSILIKAPELAKEVKAYNAGKMREECLARNPQADPRKVSKLPFSERVKAGFHQPYTLAGVPYPWRSEQQHAMLLGTTGTGKTTELKRIVLQARARGHDCVIFDPVGSFVESFYDPATDTILNPRDKRCKAWSIFNDADDYVDMLNAAQALIPDPPGKTGDDFWQKAARTIFVEMCMKLKEEGKCSNGALAHHLMEVKLSEIHEKLEETIAGPLVSTDAARMAASCRATLNTHANAIRFLPDPSEDRAPYSLRDWMTRDDKDRGSILFLTSSYSDMVLNKPLLTMWLNIAMQALFTMGRTRDLRTWFIIDEVHALHRVPAIEQGLQTARQVGGAIILGMHSFEKLKETYGENAAYFIDGLAGTKLFFRSADVASAKHASESIGDREIRQMDEAYSYGANTIRDGTTITPTTKMQPLIIPTDMRNLPDLHGVVKLAAGFPAARVQIAWRGYEEKAEAFVRVETMRAATWEPEENADGASPFAEDGGFDPETGEVQEGNDGSSTQGSDGSEGSGKEEASKDEAKSDKHKEQDREAEKRVDEAEQGHPVHGFSPQASMAQVEQVQGDLPLDPNAKEPGQTEPNPHNPREVEPSSKQREDREPELDLGQQKGIGGSSLDRIRAGAAQKDAHDATRRMDEIAAEKNDDRSPDDEMEIE